MKTFFLQKIFLWLFLISSFAFCKGQTDGIQKKVKKVRIIEISPPCDLQNTPCSFELSSKEKFYFEVTPRPISEYQVQKANLRIQNSDWIPESLDVNGKDMNMGYNRPPFKRINENEYEVNFILDLCKSESTIWRVLILFTTKEKEKVGIPFYFTVRKK